MYFEIVILSFILFNIGAVKTLIVSFIKVLTAPDLDGLV